MMPPPTKIHSAENTHTGSCPTESRFAEAKGQGNQKKCREVRNKENKDSIAWKQSWEGHGTNAPRKSRLQI